MKKSLLLLLATAGSLLADVAFSPIFESNMVLQQGCPISISGTCTANSPVTVSFAGQTVQATVKSGKWVAQLAPLSVNAQGATLTATQGGSTATCDNVLVGEVWIASGQSNMLWRLNQTGDKNGIAQADYPLLRICHHQPQIHTNRAVYTPALFEQLEKGRMYEAKWECCSPEAAAPMSAVAFYFGRKLQMHLHRPVGIIDVALGGSEMAAWLPEGVVKKQYPELAGDRWLKNADFNKQWLMTRVKENLGDTGKKIHPYKPSYLFENGIRRWTSFPVAGVIWYQGESDAELLDNKYYTNLMRTLITSWRSAFNKPGMPFLMVQLPRINSNEPLRAYWPQFRSIQSKVADSMPGVECVCTIDLGSTNSDVHPPRKLEVGERLADKAANKVYGKTNIAADSPVITNVAFQGGKAIVTLENADGLKTKDGSSPNEFKLSADGRTFHPATATIQGDKIEVVCGEVKAPKYLRYAWSTFVEPNLVNAAGLPCMPYATGKKADK